MYDQIILLLTLSEFIIVFENDLYHNFANLFIELGCSVSLVLLLLPCEVFMEIKALVPQFTEKQN